MATDPAVQAEDLEDAVWTLINDDLTRSIGNYENPTHAAVRLAIAAATPLIRAQAFTEAADAIAAMRIAVTNGDTAAMACNGAISHAAALVRGLGEETENA